MQLVFITDVHAVLDFVTPLIEQTAGTDVLVIGGDLTNFGGPAVAARILQPLRSGFSRVLCVPGNVDQPSVANWLADEGLSLHGRGVAVDEVGFFGCGASNRTPLKTPFELDEEVVKTLVVRGYRAVTGSAVHVLVSHTPPLDTKTDRLFTGKHVGSTAVRDFIATHRVELCLCGHIHESRAQDQLGSTVVVNPGPFARGYYARVDLSAEGVSVQRCQVQVTASARWRAGVRGGTDKLVSFVRHRLSRVTE